jgi:hypothetical protein
VGPESACPESHGPTAGESEALKAMGPLRQEPYARYKIRDQQGERQHDLADYEDVRASGRSGAGQKTGMHTTVTSFGEGLRRPSQLFGSLKKAGQRFVGAEQLQGSITSSVKRLTGRRSKCQCRHHQNMLLEGGKAERKEGERKEGQNRAFLEAKKVFRGDGGMTCSSSLIPSLIGLVMKSEKPLIVVSSGTVVESGGVSAGARAGKGEGI